MKSVFCFFIGSFCSLLICAQDWPVPGATWYFDQEYGLCYGREFSKWEYIGDSLKPEGRKLNFIRHVARIDYPAPGVVNKSYFQQNNSFLERNDSLFFGNSTLIADFNRITGDSTFSPFQGLPLAPFCSENDSLLVLQKPLVTAHGLQTVGNRSFKWYRIQYLSVSPEDQSLFLAEMEFHQRYFTPESWFLPTADWIFCGSIFEYCYEVFQCYQDDLMPPATCSSAVYEWQHLSIKDETASKSVSVFPNPVSEVLTLQIKGSSQPLRLEIRNVQGVLCKEITSVASDISSYDVSLLSSGMYMIHVFYADGRHLTQKFIKQ